MPPQFTARNIEQTRHPSKDRDRKNRIFANNRIVATHVGSSDHEPHWTRHGIKLGLVFTREIRNPFLGEDSFFLHRLMLFKARVETSILHIEHNLLGVHHRPNSFQRLSKSADASLTERTSLKPSSNCELSRLE